MKKCETPEPAAAEYDSHIPDEVFYDRDHDLEDDIPETDCRYRHRCRKSAEKKRVGAAPRKFRE